jgi:hypothetical protein
VNQFTTDGKGGGFHGATLVNVCHVIAARDMVSPKMLAAWVEAFYAKLPQRSLSEALDYALKASQAPMVRPARTSTSVPLQSWTA